MRKTVYTKKEFDNLKFQNKYDFVLKDIQPTYSLYFVYGKCDFLPFDAIKVLD